MSAGESPDTLASRAVAFLKRPFTRSRGKEGKDASGASEPKPANNSQSRESRPVNSNESEIENAKSKGHALKIASIFILSGIVLIFLAILCEPHDDPGVSRNGISVVVPAIWSLVEKIGEALIVVGLIDVIIHLPDWNKYFLDNLKSSLIDDSYLTRLDQNTLRSLAKRILVASFREQATAMVSRGGFFDFFFDDMRAHMAAPFREAIVCDYACEEADKDHFLIHDNLTYLCREISLGAGIQGNVRWTNDEAEISELVSIKVETTTSKGTNTLYEADEARFKSDFPRGDFDKELGSFREDRLLVKIVSTYKVRRDMFQYWTMTHLTRDLNITLRHPPGYRIHLAYFGVESRDIVPTPIANGLTLRYPSWILPNTGIAWKFIKNA